MCSLFLFLLFDLVSDFIFSYCIFGLILEMHFNFLHLGITIEMLTCMHNLKSKVNQYFDLYPHQ